MKPLIHCATITSCIAVAVVPRLAWPTYYAHTITQSADNAAQVRAQEIERDWKSRPFTSVSQPDFDRSFMARISWSSLGLSDLQTIKLRARVEDLVHYFEHPDFNEYYRLKTQGVRYEFVPRQWTTNFLRPTPVSAERSDDSVRQRLFVLWEKVHSHNGKTALPKLTAIAVDSISGAVAHTNSGRVMLGGPIKQGFTVAAEALEPGFVYPSAQKTSSAPLLFEFSFLAKANDSGVAGPLYISLIWLDHDETWALNRMVLDTWHGFTTLF